MLRRSLYILYSVFSALVFHPAQNVLPIGTWRSLPYQSGDRVTQSGQEIYATPFSIMVRTGQGRIVDPLSVAETQ
ncbi:MAG: hypothetical protein R2824_30930 [Saprospiraceae bacterium]